MPQQTDRLPETVIVLLVPRHLVPPERLLDITKVGDGNLVDLHRNTALVEHRERTRADTMIKHQHVAGGLEALRIELLRRLTGEPSPSGASDGAAALVKASVSIERSMGRSERQNCPERPQKPRRNRRRDGLGF